MTLRGYDLCGMHELTGKRTLGTLYPRQAIFLDEREVSILVLSLLFGDVGRSVS